MIEPVFGDVKENRGIGSSCGVALPPAEANGS
jgi:hypothetical protein